MIDASWLVFVVASLVLIATPGQDMILVMSRSVAQGAAAGVVTAGRRQRRPRRPHGSGHARTRRDPADVRVAVRRAEARRRGLPRSISASVCCAPSRGSLPIGAQGVAHARQALRRRRGLQSVQSQDRDLLLCLPAAIRLAVGAASDAHGVRPGARLRGADVSGQGAGRHLRRQAFGLAALAARRAHLGVSFVRRDPGRPGREAGIRAALMSTHATFARTPRQRPAE